VASLTGIRERKKADRRERILDAALRLFHEHGFHGTTFSRIAREAHVSRGTVFNYFPYKEAILIAYFARYLEAARGRLVGDPSDDGSQDPISAVYRLFDELAAFVDEHRELVLPLSYELLNPDPERSKAAYLALPLVDILRPLLAAAERACLLREDHSRERLARTLANTYFITALQWAAYRQNRHVRDELRTALRLTLEGVLRRVDS
jgi:AcrR family transcriptional regulator